MNETDKPFLKKFTVTENETVFNGEFRLFSAEKIHETCKKNKICLCILKFLNVGFCVHNS